MTLEELKLKNAEYSNKINSIQLEQQAFQQENYKLFCKFREDKQVVDKQWFIENFDYIWKHKERFRYNEPFKNILIDFLPIFKHGGLVGGTAFNDVKSKIFLEHLITLWDEGFIYKSYPIISLQVYYHHGKKIIISYIKDNKEVTETLDSAISESEFLYLTNLVNRYTPIGERISDWDRYKTIDILKKRED